MSPHDMQLNTTSCIFLPKIKLNTVKPVLTGHSKLRPKLFFKTYYRLMQVKSIAECSPLTFMKLPFFIKIVFVYF